MGWARRSLVPLVAALALAPAAHGAGIAVTTTTDVVADE